MKCRGCSAELSLTFLDLGMSPIANNLIDFFEVNFYDKQYPLHALTCEKCGLVQLSEAISKKEIFHTDYPYYSSFSITWLKHCSLFVNEIIDFLDLTNKDLVIEVASNDGYLLQYFYEKNIEVLGIDPAIKVANTAINKGIPTLIDFFGENLAIELANSKKPKLIIGNNVLAHVPDLHDFIKGLSILIDDNGLITLEFPHLLNLIKNIQFDTIYHEHYSYLNASALVPIFKQYGLKIMRIDKLNSHGGSLRIFVTKIDSMWSIDETVQKVLAEEARLDPRIPNIYKSFQNNVTHIKDNLLSELNREKNKGKKIAAYGAAAKGVTLLNYCEITTNLIDFVVDRNPNKSGKFIPGVKIPIYNEEFLKLNLPDLLLVLPWNLANEIKNQISPYLKPDHKILRAIPRVEYI